MSEEMFIQETCGKENHFLAPEGYFDEFAIKLTKTISCNEEQSDIVKMKPRLRWRMIASLAAAAGLLGVLFNIEIPFFHTSESLSNSAIAGTQASMVSANYEIEQIADYAMMDVDDIYAYVFDY